VEPYGEVIWNGTKDAEFQKSQQRQPDVQTGQPVKNPGSSGRVWHVKHATAEDQRVIDMRSNWQRRREQPIATAKLPRGEFVKT
jgi:hypothetical protein